MVENEAIGFAGERRRFIFLGTVKFSHKVYFLNLSKLPTLR